jgi:hypothetical protein
VNEAGMDYSFIWLSFNLPICPISSVSGRSGFNLSIYFLILHSYFEVSG